MAVKFEFAARAIASMMAMAENIPAKKQDDYIERNWQKLIPQCAVEYDRFIARQIANGATPLDITKGTI